MIIEVTYDTVTGTRLRGDSIGCKHEAFQGPLEEICQREEVSFKSVWVTSQRRFAWAVSVGPRDEGKESNY